MKTLNEEVPLSTLEIFEPTFQVESHIIKLLGGEKQAYAIEYIFAFANSFSELKNNHEWVLETVESFRYKWHMIAFDLNGIEIFRHKSNTPSPTDELPLKLKGNWEGKKYTLTIKK